MSDIDHIPTSPDGEETHDRKPPTNGVATLAESMRAALAAAAKGKKTSLRHVLPTDDVEAAIEESLRKPSSPKRTKKKKLLLPIREELIHLTDGMKVKIEAPNPGLEEMLAVAANIVLQELRRGHEYIPINAKTKFGNVVGFSCLKTRDVEHMETGVLSINTNIRFDKRRMPLALEGRVNKVSEALLEKFGRECIVNIYQI